LIALAATPIELAVLGFGEVASRLFGPIETSWVAWGLARLGKAAATAFEFALFVAIASHLYLMWVHRPGDTRGS
jgi:hypothetical protein